MRNTAGFKDDDEDIVQEVNIEFVKAFDCFSTFKRVSNYIEDWIRAKRHNATDFATDFPAIINRGLLIRRLLLKVRKERGANSGEIEFDHKGDPIEPEIRQVHLRILTKKLYLTEDDYTFFFALDLLEACSLKNEVPLLVIRIALNHIGILISEGKIKITEEMQMKAK